jgi:hypothetical protein
MPINMGELLPTPPVMQPPTSASPGSTGTEEDLNKAPEKAIERVLCHHCGRTASNGISCEGYCVADSNY